jgi:hypothetical protein
MQDEIDLLKTVRDWIDENGGAKLLADIIVSENHEIFTHEAVKADERLHKKGIFSYSDIKPLKHFQKSDYFYKAIEYMYPHHSYVEMSNILGKPTHYISKVVFILIKQGVLTRLNPAPPLWSKEEDDFIKANAHCMSSGEIAEKLNRTVFSVGTRKYKLRVRMNEKYYKPRGRYAHKHNHR